MDLTLKNTPGYFIEWQPGIISDSEDHFGWSKDLSLLQYYCFFILNEKQQQNSELSSTIPYKWRNSVLLK